MDLEVSTATAKAVVGDLEVSCSERIEGALSQRGLEGLISGDLDVPVQSGLEVSYLR